MMPLLPLVLKVNWFSLQPCTAYCYIHVFSLFYSELCEFDCFSLSRPGRTAIFMSVVYFTTNFLSLTGSLSRPVQRTASSPSPQSSPPCLSYSSTCCLASVPSSTSATVKVCMFGFISVHFTYRSDVSNTAEQDPLIRYQHPV